MKYLITLLLCIPTFVFSQGWEKIYDNGSGLSVQQTTDGGYIVVGSTYNTKQDIYMIKTDENGDTLWTKTYNFSEFGWNFGYSVQQTTDGGYIITGNITLDTITNTDVSLIKTDENGDTLWTKTYGGFDYESGQSVQQTNDEGYIITGFTSSFGNGNEIYLIKTDGIGDTLWTKTFGGQNHDIGYSVRQTMDGGYIITGQIETTVMLSDLYLIKTDENGDTLWTKTYGDRYFSGGNSVQQTTDGGYIITGWDQDSYESLLYLVKTDGNGDTLWTKTYSKYNKTNGCSVQQTTDEGYIITGYSYSFDYDRDIYLLKTDGNGDTLWTRTYTFGENDWDLGYSVQQTTDGGYIITGINNMNHGDNIFLLKTDEFGNITRIIELPTPNLDRKLVRIIDMSGREIKKPKKNIPYIEIYDDGTSQKKVIVK